MFRNFAKMALIGFLFVSLLSISSPAAAKGQFVGDFNGDEQDDFVITGPWGLGILTYDGNDTFKALMMKPNGTLFGGWSLDTRGDKVRAIADFNGDGTADLLMTSLWGMGIFTLEGDSLRALYAAPWDDTISFLCITDITVFGEVITIDDVSEGERDIIKVGDFNGDGQADILQYREFLECDNGRGSQKEALVRILSLSDSPGHIDEILRIRQSGDLQLGEWSFNTRTDRIQGIGNFDNDEGGQDDILITSHTHIGVLTLSGGTLTTLAMEQNGTQITPIEYGWVWFSDNHRIRGVGDIDNDGGADFVVTDDNGMAVFGLDSGTFVVKANVNNGDRAGNWELNSREDHIRGFPDLNDDGGNEIFVTSPWGAGALTFEDGQLTSLFAQPNGTQFFGNGSWELNSRNNTFCLFGDFVAPNGDSRDRMIVKSPWGIGLLTWTETKNEPTLTVRVAKPNDTRFRFGEDPGWLYAGWKNSLPHGLFGCGIHPDTGCAYGDPACSQCVDGLLTYLPKIDLRNKHSEYGIRTGKKPNIRPDKDFHIQGAARLADYKHENGNSIGRMILTFNGVFGPEGLMYVEQEGNDSEEAVYVNNVAEPEGDNIDIRHSGAHAFEHPGGAQAHGDTVAVSMGAGEGDVKAGVHFLRFPPGDQTGSIVSSLFFDGSNGEPASLPEPSNVNAAGFLQLASGQYLLAVAGNKGVGGTTRIYFYKGRQEYNTPGTPQPQTPINGTTKWRYLDHFDPACDGGGKNETSKCFSGAQTLSLHADCKGTVQLFTFNGSGTFSNNDQWYQLHDLIVREGGKVEMKRRMWQNSGTGSFKDDSFRYGAGTYVDRNRFLVMFNAERRTKGVKPKGQVNGEVYLAQ